jgi:hypothetical protein
MSRKCEKRLAFFSLKEPDQNQKRQKHHKICLRRPTMLRSLKRARLPHVRRHVAPGSTLWEAGTHPFQCANFHGPKELNGCATSTLARHSRLFSASVSSHDDQHHEIADVEQERDFASPYAFDSIRWFVDGPPMELGLGKLATQTHSSVVGTSGSTVLLTTVARQSMSQQNARNGIVSSSPMSSFLTVEYRQRHHGVGLIPGSTSRRDNTAPTPLEVLAGRAIDRALRPLLQDTDSGDCEAFHYHVHASVQACKLWPDEHDGHHDGTSKSKQSDIESVVDSGHPVALALNTAAAALATHLTEPVAATVLALMPNGTLLQDPTPWQIQNSHGELLYAGTREKTVMMEWSSHQLPTGLPEEAWAELLQIAHATIQPLLDTVEELQQLQRLGSNDSSQSKSSVDVDSTSTGNNNTREEEEEIALRESLGLPPAPAHLGESSTSISIRGGGLDAKTRQRRLHQAVQFCEERLGDAIQRLFGKSDETLNILLPEQRKGNVA